MFDGLVQRKTKAARHHLSYYIYQKKKLTSDLCLVDAMYDAFTVSITEFIKFFAACIKDVALST